MHREIQQVSTGCCLGGHRVWVPDIAQRAQQDRENQYRAQHSVRYSTIEYLLAALCYEASHAICYRQYQAGSTVHLSVPAVAKYHTLLSQFQHTAHRLGQYRLSRSARTATITYHRPCQYQASRGNHLPMHVSAPHRKPSVLGAGTPIRRAQ